ncbi:CRISPR-associated protein Cas4 [Opitutales bacterium ASA1]|uniref:CRISPR-associated protein Cas4 n=1 Tax=Congregicoccus parvus TaxID=3081749 RepID=UPI002B2FDF7E|nr:CRISPR-associated protein Cas4 [Opitutales bacterium ASA1]
MPPESHAIPISALNHYLYCPRRAYLIHAEGVFVDNEHTLLGDLAHEHVDFPGYEQRAGWTLLRALPLFSDRLGLSGKADLVEIQRDPSGRVTAARPVEYKKGPKRRWSNDEVQLCAQALCLEEMFSIAIDSGMIYHAQSERRAEVVFDSPMRERTLAAIANLRSEISNTVPPSAELKPQCDGCSLHEVCMPEATGRRDPRLYEPRTY